MIVVINFTSAPRARFAGLFNHLTQLVISIIHKRCSLASGRSPYDITAIINHISYRCRPTTFGWKEASDGGRIGWRSLIRATYIVVDNIAVEDVIRRGA